MIGLSALGLSSSPVSPPVVYHIDRIRIGDFSKEKKSGTKSYEHNEHCEGMEPRRHMGIKVEGRSHKEGAGEKCNSRDLPIQAVVVKPEGVG